MKKSTLFPGEQMHALKVLIATHYVLFYKHFLSLFRGRYLSCLLLPVLASFSLKAQILYGTTDHGYIFKYDVAGKIATIIYLGGNAMGDMLAGPDKKLYGKNGQYSFDPSTSTYTSRNIPGLLSLAASDGKIYSISDTALYSFDPATNNVVVANDMHDFGTHNLLEAADGKLYGITSAGALYSFDLSSHTYVIIDDTKDFGDFVMQADNGLFYGIVTNTAGTGDYPNGLLYSFDLATSTYTPYTTDESSVGRNPDINLVQKPDGKLYGRMAARGLDGEGSIFSFDPSTGNFQRVYDLNLTDRAYAGLTLASNGKLYTVFYDGNNGSSFIWPDYSTIPVDEDNYEFSNATLVEISQVILPVTILSFNAVGAGSTATLEWNTSNEQNLKSYIVERSANGFNFSNITSLQSVHSPNSKTYTFIDVNIPLGINYYRLKMLDNDGNYTYSRIVKVVNAGNKFYITNTYPKPALSQLSISWNAPAEGTTAVEVFDLTGRMLKRFQLATSTGMNYGQIPIDGLPNGQYILMLSKNGESITIKFSKQ